MMKPRNVPKASPSAQAPATVAEPALEKKTPLPLKFDLEGYDFSEFAAFLRAHDPAWVDGKPTSSSATRADTGADTDSTSFR